MISPIGNEPGFAEYLTILSRVKSGEAKRESNLAKTDAGISFFETMVAVMILSGGLLFIYKAFFISLDYTNHLTCRLYANIFLDEKISSLQRILDDQNQIPFIQGKEIKTVWINGHNVDFQYTVDLRSVEDLKGLFEADISISWQQGTRRINLSREAYLFNLKPLS